MNFLFILDFYTPSKGWVERVFESIISQLEKQGHNIKVLTSHYDKNLPKYEKIWNVEVCRVGKWRLFFTLLASFFWLKLLKNIDIIHTSTYNAAYVAKFLSFFKKTPIILTSHEIVWQAWYDFKWKKWYFYKKFEDFIYSFGFYYVFVSNHIKNVWLTSYKLDLLKLKTIYNWVWDIKTYWKITRKELGFKQDDIIWIFHWRPGWTKGLDFLLDNFDNIQKLNPNFKLLLLVLEKNNEKKIKNILSKVKNFDDIKIIYEVEHNKVYDYIELSDIGIVPSRTEGFGFSALELSIMKKKNVFSFVWGIPEVNFWDIHFFKVWNQEEFLKSFEEIFNWKVNNYSYNKELTEEKMFNKYNELYKSLVSK